MNTFKRYVHPARKPQFFSSGFCWLAFFLSIPWLIWHRLYSHAFVVLLVEVAIAFAAKMIATNQYATADRSLVEIEMLINSGEFILAAGATFILSIIVAINCQQWRSNKLEDRGFTLESTISAKNYDAATAALLTTPSK